MSPKPPPTRLAYNIDEACTSLGIGWDFWKTHIEPDIHIIRIGARKLVPVSELERWLEANGEAVGR